MKQFNKFSIDLILYEKEKERSQKFPERNFFCFEKFFLQ